jgi:hypothetical protein
VRAYPVHIWRMGARSRAPREIIEPRKSARGEGGREGARRRTGDGGPGEDGGRGGESRGSRIGPAARARLRTLHVAYKDSKESVCR